jgi:hypothetical protein
MLKRKYSSFILACLLFPFMYHRQIYCLLVDEDDDANDIGLNDIFGNGAH